MTYTLGHVVERGDGRDVKTVTSVEDGVGCTPGEPGPFFHIFMCESVENIEICGCDIMDCEEESDGGEKVITIDPKFVF